MADPDPHRDSDRDPDSSSSSNSKRPISRRRKRSGPFSRLVGDVWTQTAEHLDLVNIESLAQVSRAFYESWRQTDKVPILVREAVRARTEFLDGSVRTNKNDQVCAFEQLPEFRRLVAKRGSRSVMMKSRNSALKNILEVAVAQRWPLMQIKSMAKELFNISYRVGNPEAMRILSEFKAPDPPSLAPKNVLPQSSMDQVLILAAKHGQVDVLWLLIQSGEIMRLSLSGLNDALREASKVGDKRVCSCLLATIAQHEPRDLEVNNYVSKAMNSCAENGHAELCIELITQFQLRVRFRQMRMVERRNQQQQQRCKFPGSMEDVDEEIELQLLEEEEVEVANGLRSFRQALNNVLQIACRGQHLDLITRVLSCKASNEIKEETLEELLKTAVRNGNEDLARLLVDNRHVNSRAIAGLFVDAARRGHSHSIRALLETGCVQEGTILAAKNEATRRGYSSVLAIIDEY